jgi:transposase
MNKGLLRELTLRNNERGYCTTAVPFWGAFAAMPVFITVNLDRFCGLEGLFAMSQNTTTESTADYYLGCDVAKAKLDVSLIDARGVALWADVIPNEPAAIATYLLTLTGHHPGQTVECVVEATSTYHYALQEMCHQLSLPCRVYNPLITKSGIKSTVRGKKTDRTDALVIARMGLRGEGRLHTPELYMQTKHYARGCQKLSILSSSFRQYKTHFTELLDGEITSEFTELLQGVQQAITEARGQLYKDLAVSAKGPVFTRLQTIPGVGPYVASSLLGEVQDMTRFGSSKALVAYAGLDPKVTQSGKSLNSTGRLTKRGSSYLRRSVFLAANIARRHDAQFRALYDKKRAEGKTHTEATCVVARKLLRVIRSVWLSGEDYTVPEVRG